MTKNVQINRKKLGRFLESLKVRTSEELNERKRIGEEYVFVENNYLTIKENASHAVFSNNHTRVIREPLDSLRNQSRSVLNNEEEHPKYIPASKYPLPMYPMQYKPAQKCKNASRLLNLSKLRPQRSRSASAAPIKREVPKVSFPGFTVEKIDVDT